MSKNVWSRRRFMQMGTAAVAAGAASESHPIATLPRFGATAVRLVQQRHCPLCLHRNRGTRLRTSRGDFAGAGWVECVAACDLYDSRHLAAQRQFRTQVPTTRNYKEILDRVNVFAVKNLFVVTRGRNCF